MFRDSAKQSHSTPQEAFLSFTNGFNSSLIQNEPSRSERADFNQRQVYSSSDKAVYLALEGRKLANLFEESALINQDNRAIVISDLLRETYRAANIYHATDLINRETGELFDGYGALTTAVNTRISKVYLTASARRARKGIREKLAKNKLLVGERYRFLTLTMPYLRAEVSKVLEIKDRAFELFRKRKLWTSNVRAAFVSEEMTIGASSTMSYTHFHAHAHALLASKRIEQWQIADVWTDCVETACAEFGIEFLMPNTVSNRLITHIVDVETFGKKRGKTLEDTVTELCAYVVKGSEYEKVPRAEIVKIEKALFNRRMIKSYGDFNNQKGKGKAKNSSENTSIYTKDITDGATNLKTKKARRESLINTGVRLIREGKRAEWLEFVALEMESRREFRAEQLAFKYPHATFRTLDGKRWFGVSERPPKVVVSLSAYRKRREKHLIQYV